ncbi:MAG TPA: response regulator [candidate division Zixibacteria bacterium]|nr:response regulator [candidate division Zixibacteria bacterium]
MAQNKKRILIVDDDEAVLESIGDYLALKGYIVDTAKTGTEAIEKSRKGFFNLAILDIRLPDVDGTELLTKMHNTEPKMMKVMLTGYPNSQNAIDSVNRGADAYLVKPVQLEKLFKLIEQKLAEQDKETKMDKDKLVSYIESRDKEFDEK